MFQTNSCIAIHCMSPRIWKQQYHALWSGAILSLFHELFLSWEIWNGYNMIFYKVTNHEKHTNSIDISNILQRRYEYDGRK